MLHAVLLLLVGVLLGSLVTLGAAFSASRCDVDIVAAALRENSEVAQENVDFHFRCSTFPPSTGDNMNVFVVAVPASRPLPLPSNRQYVHSVPARPWISSAT